MAKIIIGNVRGKDGRGITKIVKTASTGAVDTYTITYTDSTTSTFTINNSDNIALQRQIVPSAAVESSTTASQAYAAGDYVVVGGVLRRATSSIAKGSTIGDSNSTATTVAGEIKAVRDSVSHSLKVKKYSVVVNTNSWVGVASASEIAEAFGVKTALLDTDFIFSVFNGDVLASAAPVMADLSSTEGLKVRSPTKAPTRINVVVARV